MITIPMQRADLATFDLLVVFEELNVTRLKEHDPAEIDIAKFPEPFPSLKLNKVFLAFASPVDTSIIAGLATRGDVPGLLNL